MMNRILEMIKAFLDEDVTDATDFSVELEDALCDGYDAMVEENPEVTEILNEELPDICAAYELGDDIEEFKEKVKAEYEKAIKMM